MSSALPHWEPTFGPPRPAAILVAPAVGALPPRRRGGLAVRPTAASLLLHGLILVLILVELGLPDWLKRTPEPPPPTIEVALVVEPPPPPAPPVPKPPTPPPQPLPRAPQSSDAQSEGPGKPSPAKQEDEPAPAVAKPEPGPQAAPPEPKKVETVTPQPAPKPQAVERRPPTPAPPPPRSTLHTPRQVPAPAAPVKPAEPETQTAAAAPPKEIAPTPRGESPPAPAFGKAVYRGFAMAALDPPAGMNPAVYNAYLAAIRDKIALERGRLRTFRYSGGGVRLHFALDHQGRLQQAGVIASSGSRALENTVLNMLSYAAPFPAPPPEFGSGEILLRFDMILPTTAADWEEFLAGAKPG